MRLVAAAVLGLTLSACASAPEPEPNSVNLVVDEQGKIQSIEGGDPGFAKILEFALRGGLSEDALSDDEIWRSEDDGNLRHIQSGGICPQNWGSFERTQNVIYDQNGSDVGCNYVSNDLYTDLTFYFYRNDEPLEQEFAGVMDIVKNRHPASKDSALPNINVPGSQAFSYLSDAIEFSNSNGIKLRSGALLTEREGWRVKMRVTYPADFAAQIETIAPTMLLGQFDRMDANGIAPDAPEETPTFNQET